MTTPTYLGYSDFSGSLHVSYIDYLQAREFSDANLTAISAQTKRLVTASDKIGNSQLVAFKQAGEKIGELVYQVQQSNDELKAETRAGFERVSSVLEWGFSEILFKIGKTNDLLSELLKVEKNKSKTWAYEKFEDARDEFNRHLYAEALVSVGYAIEGFSSNLGYKTEYRFHYLKGLITLGSFENADPKIVNLEESECAFLAAARYSKHLPEECANAWLCAGRAAELRGALEISEGYFDRGLGIVETAGLYYERARVRAARNNVDASMVDLKSAIKLDLNLILKALRDIEFSRFKQPMDEVLASIRAELSEIGDKTAREIQNEIAQINLVKYTSILLDSKILTLKDTCHDDIFKLETQLTRLKNAVENGGIMDISTELGSSVETTTPLLHIDAVFKRAISQDLREKLAKLQGNLNSAAHISAMKHSESEERSYSIPGVVCLGYGILGILGSCGQRGGEGFFMIIGVFLTVPIIYGITHVIMLAVGTVTDQVSGASTKHIQTLAENASVTHPAEISQVEGRVFYSPSLNLEATIPNWAFGK